jgi:HK97 family phage major capsid protein
VPVYDSIISRSDSASTIPEEVATDVIKAATQQSAALSLCRRVNLGSKTARLPVVSALAQAFWVAGDTGLKQTTEMAWAGVTLVAEELAAIVPVPEAVIADSGVDLWAEVREGLAEAVGIALDKAVFMGTDKPASWPAAIVPSAITAGNTAEQGTATVAQGGIVGDIDTALDVVEADGFDPNAIAAKRSLRGLLRRARDSQGQRLADVGGNTLEGLPVSYVGGGVLDAITVAVLGDYQMAVIGLRQDMTFKLLDQATITDAAGNVVYNLAQQDMVALRVVFRAGFAVGNPVNREGAGGANQYPFSVLQNVTP